MPLSEDSRALLALLLGRGKSYADISSLLGIDEAEVRSRAGKALAEMDPSAPAPDPDLTDYLLGQADPITRADVGNRLSDDPALAGQAEALTDQLRLLVPGADLPRPGSAEGGRPRPAPRPAAPADETDSDSRPGSRGLPSITSHQRRLIALLVGGALLAVVVILLVTGVFSGSDDKDSNPEKTAPTVAVLEPASGQQGSGKVEFGLDSSGQYAANINVEGLDQIPKDKSYTVWLSGSVGAYPIYLFAVDKQGGFAGQVPLNAAIACVVAGDVFPEVKVSLVNTDDLKGLISQVKKQKANQRSLPEYEGKTKLQGLISMPQEAKQAVVSACQSTTTNQ